MQMEKRQAIIAIGTIIAFIFLTYQVYHLVRDNISLNSTADISTPISGSTLPKASDRGGHNALTKHPAQSDVTNNNMVNSQSSSPNQREFIRMASLYQLEKMKHQLLMEQAAIARVQNQIVLLHLRSNHLHQVGGAAMSIKKDNVDINTDVSSNVSADSGAGSKGTMQLSYLGFQGNQWHAVILMQGVYYDVAAGSHLFHSPWQVVRIDREGVILRGKNKKEHLTFSGIEACPVDSNKITHSTLTTASSAAKPPPAIPAVKKATQAKIKTQPQIHNFSKSPLPLKQFEQSILKMNCPVSRNNKRYGAG